MQKGIRSYFQVISKKSGREVKIKTPEKGRKPAKVVIDSDEDVIYQTPEQPSQSKKVDVYRKRIHVISSDSEDDTKAKETAPKKKVKSNDDKPKLKPVNVSDVFSNTPIKQSKVVPIPRVEAEQSKDKKLDRKKKKKGKSKNTEVSVHDDKDFEKTLLELDDDLLLENVDMLDKTIDEALSKSVTGGEIKKDGSSKENSPQKVERKRARDSSVEEDVTSNKRKKLEHTDSGIDPDQDAYEKKRYSAMLYQKYKNRGGPKNHGSKELPKGKPDCLKNLTFLRTGVLDSLESEEFENLIKEHGGRLVHAVSKKVSYVVVGDDPGPAKLQKAQNMNIPNVSEDELLDMILKKSGMPPKYVQTNSKVVSEDLGIGTEEEPLIEVKKTPKKNASKSKEIAKFVSSLEKTPSKSNVKDTIRLHRDVIKKDNTNDKKKILKEPESSTSKVGVSHSKIIHSEDLQQIERPKTEVATTSMSWTEKYKPKEVKSIIGQQGPASNLNKLKKWLMNWDKNQQPNSRGKIPKPSPWAKSDDGAYFKCALLSGPPGVGKTTTATLVCKELGYDAVEFNASDTRSKKLLQSEVGQLLSTNTIAGYANGQKKTDKRRVLLMDEVDGMAGNEDRGGIQELINLIKGSNIPIICMCNDRNHPKIRSLVNYCFDLKFSKPRMEQIKGAMMSVCFKEDLKILPDALAEIINGTGCDIRQTLNHLSMWTAANKSLSAENAEKEAKVAKKDTVLGPWEVVRLVFSEEDKKNMSLADKSRLFFYDYSLGPLFVQENYLKVQVNCKEKEEMKRVALAADAISMGDLVEAKIRGTNNWSLLESQAMYSSVLPGFYMSGYVRDRINFPGWLGKNSTRNKFKRMLSELQVHTRMSTSGSKLAMKLDYLVPLRDAIINPLKRDGVAGVPKAVSVMKEYNLLREDLDSLVELCRLSANKNPFNQVETKVKSAFTRAYNKEGPLLPFATTTGVSKKKAAIEDTLLGEEEDMIDSDGEDKDDLKADGMIKVKDKTGGKNKKDTDKAKSSKKPDSKKGKGRGKKTTK